MHIVAKYITVGIVSAAIANPINSGLRYSRIQQAMDEQLAIHKEEVRIREIEAAEKLREIEEQLKLEEEIKKQSEPCYNPYNLRELSNLSQEQIHKILEGTSLQTLSRAYYYIEQEYKVNILFIMALNAEESGWGRSSLSISNNNLGGIKSKSGGYANFNDWGQCVEFIANLIDKEYLSEDGMFYNGVSIWNVNVKYCEQDTWSDKINTIANEMLSKLNR